MNRHLANRIVFLARILPTVELPREGRRLASFRRMMLLFTLMAKPSRSKVPTGSDPADVVLNFDNTKVVEGATL
jgi:hypothetical protein